MKSIGKNNTHILYSLLRSYDREKGIFASVVQKMAFFHQKQSAGYTFIDVFTYIVNSIIQKKHNFFIRGLKNSSGILLLYMKQYKMTTLKVRD